MKTMSTHGPSGYPLLGNLPDFLRNKLNFLLENAQKYGDWVELKLGEPTFLLNNADDIKYILTTNHKNYEKTPRLTSERGRKFSGKGILTTKTHEHLRQRRALQPAFHFKGIAKFAREMVDNTDEATNKWQHGTEINIAEVMMQLAQKNILRAVFSNLDNRLPEIAEDIITRRTYLGYIFGSLFPYPEYLPNSINRQYRQAKERLDRFINDEIERRRQPNAADDLLTMLMNTRYDDGTSMSVTQLKDEALTIMLTGYETIGEALAWCWHQVAMHPQITDKLCKEIDSVLGGKAPEVSDLSQLKYTESIISETLRFLPPTWIYIRMATNADTLPSGAKVPAGAKIYLCPYTLHRNPQYYPDPDRFDPDRFLPDVRKKRHRFAYIPFGGGTRLCIGEAYAKMQCVIILARITQQWRLSLISGQEISPVPGITLHPDQAIKMKVNQRK